MKVVKSYFVPCCTQSPVCRHWPPVLPRKPGASGACSAKETKHFTELVPTQLTSEKIKTHGVYFCREFIVNKNHTAPLFRKEHQIHALRPRSSRSLTTAQEMLGVTPVTTCTLGVRVWGRQFLLFFYPLGTTSFPCTRFWSFTLTIVSAGKSSRKPYFTFRSVLVPHHAAYRQLLAF